MSTPKTPPIMAVGRRKCSVARAKFRPGEGRISINGREVEKFFGGLEHNAQVVWEPLKLTERDKKYDIEVSVNGGGNTGQAGAIRLAIARVLIKIEPDLRPTLSKAGMLSRDPRMVERKKYGQDGARKRFQYSKR